MEPINLALAGGGIKVISFCGALYYLNKHFDIYKIKRVIATSAGAVIGLMLICNFPITAMLETCKNYDFKELMHIENLLNNVYMFITDFGFYSGKIIEDWVKEILITRNWDPDITFTQLYNHTGKELILTTTNLNTKTLILLCPQNTPDLKVATAIRMAMTFPLYFSPVDFNKNIYVDGAIICNYPINYLDQFDPNYLNNTIGFILECDVDNMTYHKIGSIIDIITMSYRTFSKENDKKIVDDENIKKISIIINTKHINTFDFHINDEEKERLFARGYRAARDYIKHSTKLV